MHYGARVLAMQKFLLLYNLSRVQRKILYGRWTCCNDGFASSLLLTKSLDSNWFRSLAAWLGLLVIEIDQSYSCDNPADAGLGKAFTSNWTEALNPCHWSLLSIFSSAALAKCCPAAKALGEWIPQITRAVMPCWSIANRRTRRSGRWSASSKFHTPVPGGMSTGVALGVIQGQIVFQIRVTEDRERSGDRLLELVLDLLDSLNELWHPRTDLCCGLN